MRNGINIFIIPSRKGSKGLPGKNTKLLGGKPLIAYTIEFAKKNSKENDIICISSDDPDVFKIAKSYNVEPDFIRPYELCTDKASTFDVIKHALEFYQNNDLAIDNIILLQPTSPFRLDDDFISMKALFETSNADMVVSVKIAKENPYFTLFKENAEGNLEKFIQNELYFTRQECPPAYVYNGSIYIVRKEAFDQKFNFAFNKIRKFIMPEERSVDIDTYADWALAEYYLKKVYENS